jgi:hypothetical protein
MNQADEEELTLSYIDTSENFAVWRKLIVPNRDFLGILCKYDFLGIQSSGCAFHPFMVIVVGLPAFCE